MKLIFTSFIVIFFHCLALDSMAMPLADALDKGLITMEISENSTGTHYSAPLILRVNSQVNQDIELELDNGYTLLPADSSEQKMIVTNRLLVNLNPGESKDVFINAMCLEQDDSAPSEESAYFLAGLAPENLRKLSAFIEENERFEPDAQFLMWDLAEGAYASDEIDEFQLDEDGGVWVVNSEGMELEPIIEYGDVEESQRQLIVYGEFEMNFSREKNVHIAMFNDQNVIVKELFKDPKTPIGKTSLNYEFNSLEYEEEVYFVKLVVDGEVLLTRTIEMQY